jgi:N6-L-threonylcarbamoyladenine synthase
MANKDYILGIDTSCDETSFAVLHKATGDVLSNTISSQIKLHAPYGGIVPELASRSHCENISLVCEKSIQDAGITSAQLCAIAVTKTPGLIGCLLVGASFAKALAFQLNIPLFGVNHLVGHLLSPFMGEKPVFPCLGLVVSGGHTAFYEVNSFEEISLLGQTVDDAAGEAFDKCAKLLDLGYPGGPVVDKLAKEGDEKAFNFTVAKVKMGREYLSFSGLKTAVYHHVQKQNLITEQIKKDLCASLQSSIVKALTEKIAYFFQQKEYKVITVSGGVALNSLLRKRVQEVCDNLGVSCYMAKPKFCGDNGAMIGYAALMQKHDNELFTLNVHASKKINARKLKKLTATS